MTFEELEIIPPIKEALSAEGYTQPTPIQEKSIPALLKRKDLLGIDIRAKLIQKKMLKRKPQTLLGLSVPLRTVKVKEKLPLLEG